MVSQRGTLNLFHTEAQRDLFTRRANAMRLLGVDAEAVSASRCVKRLVPLIDLDNGRFPVLGGFLQRRGGTVRHDAVAWGYARAASARGVDIIEHCEVTGIRRGRPACHRRRHHARPYRRRHRRVWPWPATPRAWRRWRACACLSRPTCCRPLSPRASSPCLTWSSPTAAGHFYVSQSDKGGLVFGGGIDGYNTYAQRGTLSTRRGRRRGGRYACMPGSRSAAGFAAMGRRDGHEMDGSPIISKTPIDGPDPQRRLVLRRLQGDSRPAACAPRTSSRTASRIRWPRTSIWTALPRAARVDERGIGPYPYAH